MNETRIRRLGRQMEIELLLLWITVNDEQEEEIYFKARRDLRDALQTLDQLALRQECDPDDQPSLLINRFLMPDSPFPIANLPQQPNADTRDQLIYELARSLAILNAPAALQSPVDCFKDGLTNDEILLLVKDWNDAHDELLGPL